MKIYKPENITVDWEYDWIYFVGEMFGDAVLVCTKCGDYWRFGNIEISL